MKALEAFIKPSEAPFTFISMQFSEIHRTERVNMADMLYREGLFKERIEQ